MTPSPPTRSLPLDAGLVTAVLEGLEAGVVAVDAAGRILLVNRAAAGILGREAADLEGRLLAEAIPAFVLPEAGPETGLETGPESARLDVRLLRPDGRAVEVGATYRPWQAPGTSLSGVYLFKDTGLDRRLVQQEERHRQVAYLDELASAFAHEVRNPLASIQAIGHLIRHERALKSLPDYGDRLERLTQRVDNLVKDLLALGRPAKPEPQRLGAERILEDCLDGLRERLAPPAPRPVPRYSEPGLEVRADPRHAGRILSALVENALDAVEDPARIALLVGTSTGPGGEPMVTFTVRDDGPGIAPGLLTKIFRPFFSTKPRGAGFGLAIAQRLAWDNQGTVDVQSEPWVETRFTLSLPRA